MSRRPIDRESREQAKPEPIAPACNAEAAVEALAADRFWGATIQLFHVEVLVVLVSMRVICDRREAPIMVGAFQRRFERTIVLAAQSRDGRPMFFGPAVIAQVLGQMPFDALAWKRYRLSRPKPLMLPLPSEPPPESRVSWSDIHVIPGHVIPAHAIPGHNMRGASAAPITRSAHNGTRRQLRENPPVRLDSRRGTWADQPLIDDACRVTRSNHQGSKADHERSSTSAAHVTADVARATDPLARKGVSGGQPSAEAYSYLLTAIRDHEQEETRP